VDCIFTENKVADMEVSTSSAINEGPLQEPLLPEENVVVIAETIYDEDQSAEMVPEITSSETLCLRTGKRLMRTFRCGTIVLLMISIGLFHAGWWMASHCITGKGKVIEEERYFAITTFNELHVSGPTNVVVHSGDSFRVKVKAHENIISHVKTRVADSEKRTKFAVEMPGCYINSKAEVQIHLPVPVALDTILSSGSGDLTVDNLANGDGHMKAKENVSITLSGSGDVRIRSSFSKTEEITIQSSGSGDLVIENLRDVGEITSRMGGSGDLHLSSPYSPACSALRSKATGSGDLKAFDFPSFRADVSSHGSGGMSISVLDTLNASTYGSGSINYKGNPTKVTKHVYGSGSIHHVG